MYKSQHYGLVHKTNSQQTSTFKLQFRYMDFIDVDIELKEKCTVLCGDNATGKSYLYNVIEQYAQEERKENILCLDIDKVDIKNPQYTIDRLCKMNNGLIIIDQADDIFRAKEIEDYVTHDRNNFYLIIGRNFYKKHSELARPVISKNQMSIKYLLNVV